MATCALVGATEFNEQHFRMQNFDFVVAVDAGFAHLEKSGIVPDMLIGDFDSLGYVPEHEYLLQYPSRKDKSDIELALEQVIDKGYDRILLYGCLGGRHDFTYAVYQLLARFERAQTRLFLIGMEEVVCVLSEGAHQSIAFDDAAQGLVSLFAFSEKLEGVNESGLAYSLDKAELRNNDPLGVSNSFCGKAATISIETGLALLFFAVEAYAHIVKTK